MYIHVYIHMYMYIYVLVLLTTINDLTQGAVHKCS